jgi:hypothetical protein
MIFRPQGLMGHRELFRRKPRAPRQPRPDQMKA